MKGGGGATGRGETRGTAVEVCSMKNRFETLPPLPRGRPRAPRAVRELRSARPPTAYAVKRARCRPWAAAAGGKTFARHYIAPAKVRLVWVGEACKTFRPCALPPRGGPYAAQRRASAHTSAGRRGRVARETDIRACATRVRPRETVFPEGFSRNPFRVLVANRRFYLRKIRPTRLSR